ncbi:unnamed protein product [Aphis gossypii]|uniref:TTF-type domain-containing protein n=1 Tax=Aphis gossypii TaxID=80765 RepID=A0A9P0NPM9_APHGO|nr:unnamed protein product [Aphis gossypii]CAH1733412.1 unnamed protein product [Aphis gossypii]
MKRFLVSKQPNEPPSKTFLENNFTNTPNLNILCTTTTHIQDPEKSMNNVSDISENADQKPVQPILQQFPRHIISNKLRSFNASWYLKRPWIEYSIRLDKIFCFYCRHFALNINHISKQDVYISLGYCDWKNICNTTIKHECSNIHKMSLEKYHAYIKSKSDGAVSSQCNNYAKKQIIKNREVLTSIIRIVLYCARQDIGFRGHRSEKLQIHNIDNCQVPSNECNEIELTHYQNQGECVCVRL